MRREPRPPIARIGSRSPRSVRCAPQWIVLAALALAEPSLAQVDRTAPDSQPRYRRAEIGPEMDGPNRFALRAAHRSALKLLKKNPTCRALFEDLRLDGVAALSRNHYRQVESPSEVARCKPGTGAATEVGGSRILICRRFHSLRHLGKITILIHEALHSAGLSEWPHDPKGMTSREINERVKQACAL